MRQSGYACLVEGESDTQSMWYMGISEANIIQTYCQAAEKYPLVLFTHMADQMATSYLETNTGNKKPEDIYLGTEPAAQDPEEFAEAEPI